MQQGRKQQKKNLTPLVRWTQKGINRVEKWLIDDGSSESSTKEVFQKASFTAPKLQLLLQILKKKSVSYVCFNSLDMPLVNSANGLSNSFIENAIRKMPQSMSVRALKLSSSNEYDEVLIQLADNQVLLLKSNLPKEDLGVLVRQAINL
ncbi:MAG: hypothetical protein AB8E15_04365 [Bdellovibrionales bacterium]